MDNQEQPREAGVTPAPVVEVAAPDLSKMVQGYHAAKPVGWLVRQLAAAIGVPVGSVPGEDAEPIISFVRWDDPASVALDHLARICGGSWEVSGGALHFTIGE